MNGNEDHRAPLRVLLTFDIEVWCGGWADLDRKFPRAFHRYVYGSSRAGRFALPKTLEILERCGLKGVFFVEPLFAARFGVEPLAEIIGLIRQGGQEIQLHLHPEWQNEARTPLLDDHRHKRQGLIHYSLDEQAQLIGHGIRLLREAGADPPRAFRSGGYHSNADTFVALKRNDILIDSSLNPTAAVSGHGLPVAARRLGAHRIGEILELPLSVFRGAGGRLRHVQVGSCSFAQLAQVLAGARDAGWSYLTLMSHNFEMLLVGSSRPDWTVVRRFERLCRHLADHRDIFPTAWIADDGFSEEPAGLAVPETSAGANARRLLEQSYRRVLETGARLLG